MGQDLTGIFVLCLALLAAILAYWSASLWFITAVFASLLSPFCGISGIRRRPVCYMVGLHHFHACIQHPPLRRRAISNHVFKLFQHVLPPMSVTEREALEAGWPES